MEHQKCNKPIMSKDKNSPKISRGNIHNNFIKTLITFKKVQKPKNIKKI